MPLFFTFLYAINDPSWTNDEFGNVVAHDLDPLFEGQRLKSSYFGRLYVIISQIVTDRANVTVANT